MTAIFYDLETSSKDPIGQILNIACVTVDTGWNEISRFYAEFKLSPLELPLAGAILANRTHVLQHQEQASFTEREGLFALSQYIEGVIRSSQESVRLIGYNSQRFDLPYLRTSFIRNGINPYFGGRLQYGDLLHAVRYCSCIHDDFPRKAALHGPEDKLSLRLETIARSFGLLHGEQSHHSLDDVLLTIDVARELSERFSIDVRTFIPYMVSDREHRGSIILRMEVEYDLNQKSHVRYAPYLYVDADRRSALWLAIDKAKEGDPKRAIRYFHRDQSPFFIDHHYSEPETSVNVHEIYASLGSMSLKNFFTPSSCDLEQDIYRLDFDGVNALSRAIWDGNFDQLHQDGMIDAKALYIRHWLKERDWSVIDEKAIQRLKTYARSRYGGSLSMSKTDETICHPSFDDMLSDLYQAYRETEREEDRRLLLALLDWYKESAVVRIGLHRSIDTLKIPESMEVKSS